MPKHTQIQSCGMTACIKPTMKNILPMFRQVLNVALAFLNRFREVAATSNTKPWEAASILKQVMRDFPGHGGFVDKESRLSMQTAWQQPIEDCRILHRMKQGAVTSAIHKCGEHSREEIPTISGYVDWAMRNPGSFTRASRDWGHPYDYSGSMRHTEPYSTTL